MSKYITLTTFNDAIFAIRKSIAPLEQIAHYHTNKAVLDEITAEKITQWDSNNSIHISELELKIQSVQDNLLDYQLATNHRFEVSTTDVTTTSELLQAQVNAIT